MTAISLPTLLLRLRLWLRARSPVGVGAAILCVLGLAALAWLASAHQMLEREQELTRKMAALPPPVVRPAPSVVANENLTHFYGALGEKRYVEQQVKTLFGIAAETGLLLRQGEYKSGYDRNARLHTYQVTLPVKGSYGAIWQFAMLSLRAIPFASLDDISFKRDTIGEASVEARLRLTLYLSATPGVPR